MIFSRRSLLVAGIVTCVTATSVLAAGRTAYTQPAFDAAIQSGKPVLVEVAAPWCPTCKAQAPILGALTSEPRFKDLQAFTVDFDSQKDALKSLKATTQSTLIVFKGGKEVGRSVGDTRKESIEAMLAKAL